MFLSWLLWYNEETQQVNLLCSCPAIWDVSKQPMQRNHALGQSIKERKGKCLPPSHLLLVIDSFKFPGCVTQPLQTILVKRDPVHCGARGAKDSKWCLVDLW